MRVLSVHYTDTPLQLHSHYHEGHQLLYVVEGRARITVKGQSFPLEKGSLAVLSRLEEHAVDDASPNYKRYTLRVSHDGSQGRTSKQALLSSVLVNRGKDFRHVVPTGRFGPAFELLLSQMQAEFSSAEPLREEMLSLQLERFLITLFRCAPFLFVTEDTESIRTVRAIQQRLEQSLRDPLTLAQLAEEYHISPSHLAHRFKSVTGYAPMEYRQACRITAAKELLGNTKKPIQEIVGICGLGDESNLSRKFREITGITPTAFRRQCARHDAEEKKV